MAKKNMNALNITSAKINRQPLGDNRFLTVHMLKARDLLDTEKYVVHPSVQRGLVNSHVNSIVSGQDDTTDTLRFAPWGAVLSCLEDNVEYIFDGQHRIRAIRAIAHQQDQDKEQREQDIVTYNAKLNEFNVIQASNDKAGVTTNAVLLKKQLGITNEPQPWQPDPNAEAMLDSPVVVFSYEGEWSDQQLKALFCASNLGKRVQPNLISAFSPNNDALVQHLYELGWVGSSGYIEDKKGCNSAVFGVKDVVKAVTVAGGIVEDVQHETTKAVLAYLTRLFESIDVVDNEYIEQQKEAGLYNEGSKPFSTGTLGGSVRALLATAQVFNCVDDGQHNQLATRLGELVGSLVKSPLEVNKCVPVYVSTPGGAFKLTSATVVERAVFFWLIVRLIKDGVLDKDGRKLLTLPKRMTKHVLELDELFPNGFNYSLLGDVETVTTEDAIELLSTYLPQPKVKTARAVKPVEVKHEAPAIDTETEAELAQLTIDSITL